MEGSVDGLKLLLALVVGIAWLEMWLCIGLLFNRWLDGKWSIGCDDSCRRYSRDI
jgi:hypothetical protein